MMIFLWCLLLLSSSMFLTEGQTAGGTISSTDQGDINEALNVLLDDASILDFTRIGVGLANVGNRALTNPQWYLHSGDTNHAMPFLISTGETGLNLFARINFSVFGTEGVITYDIDGTPLCIAIMWRVPNVGSNTMNVKIYPQLKPDRDLFNQMREVAVEWGTGMWGEIKEFGVSATGSITTGWSVKQIVYIDTSGYDLSQGPSYHAWCDWNLIGRDYCIRECSPLGQCDTDTECSDDRDCDGSKLACSGACS